MAEAIAESISARGSQPEVRTDRIRSSAHAKDGDEHGATQTFEVSIHQPTHITDCLVFLA
jgi:hypothetical protein